MPSRPISGLPAALRLPPLPPLSPFPALIQALVEADLLSFAQAVTLLPETEGASGRGMVVEHLLRQGLIASAALARFCAETFGYPLLDLQAVDPAKCPLDAIAAADADSDRTSLMPLFLEGSRLTVAISDPGALPILEQIGFRSQLAIVPVIADHYQLLRLIGQRSRPALRHVFTAPTPLPGNLASEAGSAPVSAAVRPAGIAAATDAARAADAAPVVQFLQQILGDAIRLRASDIHFEPFETFFRIRFRVDGVLSEVAAPPLAIRDQMVSRIKILSGLDIAEKRMPQDGRMRLSPAAVDCRVSTLPTVFGEKVVVRLLESGRTALGLDTLGLTPAQQAMLTAAIARPDGLVLVTGPTGSGKSRTLYACLNLLNRTQVNIASVEDPAEIHLPGISQVTVNERAGLTFPVVLRAFLRQDPDIVMIGEIRDLETADLALKAAQTGHLVLSTLHTNDAAATLTRLTNMGIEAYHIAASVRLIVAQRLVRRLCVCKQPANPGAATGIEPAAVCASLLYRAVGCPLCNGSGYLGRTAIYQLLPVTPAIERLILARGSTADINRAAAAQGMQSLRQAGLEKAAEGITSLAEVLGATN